MTQCLRCKKVKFWFLMYSRFMGDHTGTYPICKSCAGSLQWKAVCDYVEKVEAVK